MTKETQERIEECVKRFREEFWKLSGESAGELDRKQDKYVSELLSSEIETAQREERERIAKEIGAKEKSVYEVCLHGTSELCDACIARTWYNYAIKASVGVALKEEK